MVEIKKNEKVKIGSMEWEGNTLYCGGYMIAYIIGNELRFVDNGSAYAGIRLDKKSFEKARKYKIE